MGRECRKAKSKFENELAKKSRTNHKAFYNYANSKLKTRVGITNLDTNSGKATTDIEKAQALNQFFMSVFTNEDLTETPVMQEKTIEIPFQDIVVTEEAILKKLRALNPHVMNELSSVISKPLAIIMSKSLEEGLIPQSWKMANVSPIFKKGSKSDCGDYRSVSLTSVICKMEGIIRDHVIEFIDANHLLSKYQHGFVGGGSCGTRLMKCLDGWSCWINEPTWM